MFTVTGRFGDDVERIFDALVEVCRDDPLYPKERSGMPSHDDGWGYVSLDENSIDHRRYASAIFDTQKPVLPDHGMYIVHARKAASGEPVGMLDAHPHHRSNTEYDVYLVHNGSYNKEKIAAELHEGNTGNQPDSEFFLEYLLGREGSIEEKIRETMADAEKYDFVKTTNNVFILAVDKFTRKVRLFYYSSSRKSNEYVTMYRVEGTNWTAVVSSSLLKSDRFPKGLSVSRVDMNELVELT